MMGNYEVNQKELNEAIAAGERALSSLRRAQQELDSARNWGCFDMFGGGTITGLIKHSKINSASSYAEQAQYDLEIFQKELKDVQIPELKIEIDSFLTFADFFFDGFFADYLMQRRINEARNKVGEAVFQIEKILRILRGNQY